MVTSVVIHQFDVPGLAVHPGEANAPLIIHANAVLSGAITPQLLETIARRYAQIIQCLSGIDQQQLSQHRALELSPESTDSLSREQTLCVTIAETPDHAG